MMCWVMLALLVAAVVAGMFGIRYTNRIVGGTDDYVDYSGGPTSYYGTAYSDYGYSVPEGQATEKSTSKGSKANVEFEKLKRELEAVRSKVEDLAPKIAEIADVKSAVADIKSKVDSVASNVKTFSDKMEAMKRDLEKGSPQMLILVTTFATRFGIAAVILLLVKILTSIYRYHARLAAHFDSKADALELCPVGDVAVLEKLCLALNTAGVDFQESADSIAEHAVDIARKVMPKS